MKGLISVARGKRKQVKGTSEEGAKPKRRLKPLMKNLYFLAGSFAGLLLFEKAGILLSIPELMHSPLNLQTTLNIILMGALLISGYHVFRSLFKSFKPFKKRKTA